jgi:hypothetical protein
MDLRPFLLKPLRRKFDFVPRTKKYPPQRISAASMVVKFVKIDLHIVTKIEAGCN